MFRIHEDYITEFMNWNLGRNVDVVRKEDGYYIVVDLDEKGQKPEKDDDNE